MGKINIGHERRNQNGYSYHLIYALLSTIWTCSLQMSKIIFNIFTNAFSLSLLLGLSIYQQTRQNKNLGTMAINKCRPR